MQQKKRAGCLAPVVSALFSGIVAPVLVQVATHAVVPDAAAPEPAAPRPRAASAAAAERRVVACGVGRTPREAREDAVGNALRAAAALLADATAWDRDGGAACAAAVRDQVGLVRRCRDLGCRGDGRLWTQEVAVDVDAQALAARLKAAGVSLAGDAVP